LFKQKLASFLVGQGMIWPLEPTAPWWLLTNYPQISDSFNWLDGFCITIYILGSGLVFGGFLSLCLSFIRFIVGREEIVKLHLAQAYLPLAAAGLFLGLSATTVKLLRYNGFKPAFVSEMRLVILVGAILWSFYLAHQILAHYNLTPRLAMMAKILFAVTMLPVLIGWIFVFWL